MTVQRIFLNTERAYKRISHTPFELFNGNKMADAHGRSVVETNKKLTFA